MSQPDDHNTILPEPVLLAGDEGVLVDELVVTGSSGAAVGYFDFWRSNDPIDYYRPTYSGDGRLAGTVLDLDMTPDNDGELHLALRYWLHQARVAITTMPDQSVEYAALIYLDENGAVKMGVISKGTATDATFDVTGIADARSILGMAHSHPFDAPSGANRFPSAQDWSTFDAYYADSDHKSQFVQMVINGGVGRLYSTDDRDTDTPGPVVFSPLQRRPAPQQSPSSEFSGTDIAALPAENDGMLGYGVSVESVLLSSAPLEGWIL